MEVKMKIKVESVVPYQGSLQAVGQLIEGHLPPSGTTVVVVRSGRKGTVQHAASLEDLLSSAQSAIVFGSDAGMSRQVGVVIAGLKESDIDIGDIIQNTSKTPSCLESECSFRSDRKVNKPFLSRLSARHRGGEATSRLVALARRNNFINVDVDEVCSLIAAGADANVSIRSKAGNTPLSIAAHRQRKEIVKVLIDAGADVNLRDKNGSTPLLKAIGLIDRPMASKLLAEQMGFDESAKIKEIAQILIDANADVNISTNEGQTPLLAAARHEYKDIVQMLIDANADVNMPDKYGSTPLLTAIKQDMEQFFDRMKYGVDMSVIEKNKKEIVRILIDADADVNLRDKDGNTSLLEAARQGDEDIAQLLIDANADVNICTTSGETPIMAATVRKDKKIVRMLIDANADVNIATVTGATPLFIALDISKDEKIEKMLRKAGAKEPDAYSRFTMNEEFRVQRI
jgi:uncharacterized protein